MSRIVVAFSSIALAHVLVTSCVSSSDKGIPSYTWASERTRRAPLCRPPPRSANIKNADECIQLYPAVLKARSECGQIAINAGVHS